MAENITPKKRVNRDKRNFATKEPIFGVLAIVGILCYRGFPIPESHINLIKDKTPGPVKTVEDDADEELWKVGQTKKIG